MAPSPPAPGSLGGPATRALAAPAGVRSAPVPAPAALALLLSGCMTANGYTTPRTLAPGQAVVTVAPEVTFNAAERGGAGGLPARTSSRFGYQVLPPSALVRVGLAPGADVGFALRSGLVPGVDVKYNFYRSDAVDLAVRPGLQGFVAPADKGAEGWMHADLPLMIGAHLGERVTLVASPGVAYARAYRIDDLGYPSPGAAGRLGLGVEVGLGRNVALVPEVTAIHSLGGDRRVWLSGGIGVLLGPRPGEGTK